MEVQILLSTMNRDDYSFLDRINLRGAVVVVNQCDRNGCNEIHTDAYSAEIIETKQRGLSNSRNEAFLHATGDIILTADDDICYAPNVCQTVQSVFEAHPEADIVSFNIKRINSDRAANAREIKAWREAPEHRYYPSVSLAYRLSSFKKANLHFHPLFGAGSRYRSGEESLLLRDARKRGLKVYESPELIATVDCSTSTWFTRYDERYFFDKGAWLRIAYPRTFFFVKYYYLRLRDRSPLSAHHILAALNRGIYGFEHDRGYGETENN